MVKASVIIAVVVAIVVVIAGYILYVNYFMQKKPATEITKPGPAPPKKNVTKPPANVTPAVASPTPRDVYLEIADITEGEYKITLAEISTLVPQGSVEAHLKDVRIGVSEKTRTVYMSVGFMHLKLNDSRRGHREYTITDLKMMFRVLNSTHVLICGYAHITPKIPKIANMCSIVKVENFKLLLSMFDFMRTGMYMLVKNRKPKIIFEEIEGQVNACYKYSSASPYGAVSLTICKPNITKIAMPLVVQLESKQQYQTVKIVYVVESTGKYDSKLVEELTKLTGGTCPSPRPLSILVLLLLPSKAKLSP